MSETNEDIQPGTLEEQLPVPAPTRYPQSNLAACMLPWTRSFELDEEVFERVRQVDLYARQHDDTHYDVGRHQSPVQSHRVPPVSRR